MHAKLPGLHAKANQLQDSNIGSAHEAVRRTLLMEEACKALKFKMGKKRNTPVNVDGVAILQEHIIRHLGNQPGTFWNKVSVWRTAIQAKAFIGAIAPMDRNGSQIKALRLIEYFSHADVVPPGEAPPGAHVSRPRLVEECNEAMGRIPIEIADEP